MPTGTEFVPIMEVAAGRTYSQDFQAKDRQGYPRIGLFLDTDGLTGVIWPSGMGPEAAPGPVPTLGWLSATDGAWRLTLHPADTQALGPGRWRVQVDATRGTDTDTLLEADLLIVGVGGTPGTPGPPGVAGPTVDELGILPQLYCTDENIAVRCGPDFMPLCPAWQVLARGSDGKFLAADPWTLASGSNDFARQGVKVGNVCSLRRSGDLMAVSASTGGNLTLRRIGMPGGIGLAPSPAGGQVGLEFAVGTFAPQIEEASYDLNERYSLNRPCAGRSPATLADVRQLRRACVLMVLLDRYSDSSRSSTGDYAAKIDALTAELSGLEEKLAIRWQDNASGVTTTTSMFSARITR